jgi:4-hydroxythreonine-4-phosphate dehydrogenase
VSAPGRQPAAVEPPDPDAPLALTMGEPAGIGAEIALAAWLQRRDAGLPTFFLLDDPDRLERLASRLDLRVPIVALDTPDQAHRHFAEALPVLPERLPVDPEPGRPDPTNAPSVIRAIDRAVALVRAGESAALVTNPIAKSQLYQAGFRHPGHTEYLAALAAEPGSPPPDPVMLLACPELRVVPTTIHVPLADVPAALTRGRILHTVRTTAAALTRDFDLARPRLVLAGLNPHAGEHGTLGREDLDTIAPAVATLQAEGLDVRGPLSADTLFHARARAGYDAAICMYHDQALIPIKTLDFARGVNVTLGLPFVRTSPDHGTAFGIAGTGTADPASLIEALRLAGRLARGRARNAPAAA